MEIQTKQKIDIQNLISIRIKDKQENIPQHLTKVAEFAKEKGLQRRGVPISTTYAANKETKEVAMEIYFPVDRAVEPEGEILFKKRLYLENCITATHKGNPQNLQDTYNALNNFIVANKLVPISPPFNVSVMEDPSNPDAYEMDIYISISPNIV